MALLFTAKVFFFEPKNYFSKFYETFSLSPQKKAFRVLDTDNDGKLSFEEFKQFAMKEPKVFHTPLFFFFLLVLFLCVLCFC